MNIKMFYKENALKYYNTLKNIKTFNDFFIA